MAPMGALIALTGKVFEPRFLVLSTAVALWVGGFDVIYALQDIEVDRREGLKSFPSRFGATAARLAAAACHLGTLALLASLAWFWHLGPAWWIGLGLAAILLAGEHLVALGGTQRHIRIAAYSINEVIPLVLLAAVAVDLYLL